jgi:hypothetical protein
VTSGMWLFPLLSVQVAKKRGDIGNRGVGGRQQSIPKLAKYPRGRFRIIHVDNLYSIGSETT